LYSIFSIHDHAAAFYNSSSIENDTNKKLSYFNIVGQTPLLGFTTGDMINQSAEKYGDKDALVVPFQNIRLTFNQLKDEVSGIDSYFMHDIIQSQPRSAIQNRKYEIPDKSTVYLNELLICQVWSMHSFT
jgi:hypothetical protein